MKKMTLKKDTIYIIIAIVIVGLIVGIIVYLLDKYRRQEMFNLIHILSNGDILWNPSNQGSNAMMGNLQPYLIRCSQGDHPNLCRQLRHTQSYPPQFADARAYSDYAYAVSQSPGRYPPRPFNATW
jgi:hypothetical protein